MPLIKSSQRQQAGITGDLTARKISANGSVSVEGKRKLWYISYTYDSGFSYKNPLVSSNTTYAATYGKVLNNSEYDYGQGVAGSLLRQKNATYVWQPGNPSYQSYADANLLELPKTVVVNSGAGYMCSETDYGYDDLSRLTTPNPPITTQHLAAPGSVRGNLSSTTRRLSATPCQSGGTWTSIMYCTLQKLNVCQV